MRCTPFNDLIASAQRDTSTSPNIISGLSSRSSNVILGKGKEHEVKQDAALQKPKTNCVRAEELKIRVHRHLQRKTSVFAKALEGLTVMSKKKGGGGFVLKVKFFGLLIECKV